jgi:hypothetical protein
MKNTRQKSDGSLNKNIPIIAVPTAPMPCPDGIGRSERNFLNGFVEKMKAEKNTNEKSQRPFPIRKVVAVFQAGCKPNFKQAGYNKINPRHSISRLMNCKDSCYTLSA